MLYFSRWWIAFMVGTVVLALIVVLPNFFPRSTVDGWPSWMPKSQIVLGLDLQGGSYLLYQVEKEAYVEQRMRTLAGEVRAALQQSPRISYRVAPPRADSVQVTILEPERFQEAMTRLEQVRNPLNSSLFGGGSIYEFDLTANAAANQITISYSDAGYQERLRTIVQQSIEVIDRRVNQLGTVEPNIQRQGDDRILVEVPGLDDPQRLKELVGQTAQLNFHMVEQTIAASDISQVPAAGQIIVPDAYDTTRAYIIDEEPLVRGEDLIDAQAGLDQLTSEPVVNFRLNTTGGASFGQVTQNNVGRIFAIVLDNEVISAPIINEPILGGSGRISGTFTVQEANDLAILLRAGALPAQLTIVEQRTIGASLGEDSIRAGIVASIIAMLGIAAFMIIFYGILGLFSVVALIGQNIIMLGILTLLGATLTLPGIAGIVLTMALAVDANVLIYERMREEARAGRSAIAAIDQGFRRAIGTIVDAHLTALIAAIALFWLGSGPIRGFAITLGIGIISTLFTAYLITRLIVSIWVRWTRPKTVPL